ncbi:LpqB family beta-propeller domain-containing protein [Mycetocola zhadangensis]|uniref:LpqB family beta-propeller domain-containing protein n=1 Tax=Mycetocola zhadangensis TaxID=1164595 RepID=UPI003A4DF942
MIRRRLRNTLLPGLVLALAVLVTGCAGIPQSGAPQIGQVVPADEDPEIEFLAQGPEKDATQEQILRGFIDAASSPRDDYATAREYLSPAIRSSWNPDASALIDEANRRTITSVDALTMQVSLVPVASVDGTGEYSEFPDPQATTRGFSLVQIDGQWRISVAPDGVVLDEQKFSEVFNPYALSFFDPSWTHLVPDLRWFPSRASTGTQIVTALLNGPSEWLAGAVTSAFPEGTQLTRNAVPIVSDVAQVDLNSEAFEADDVTLQRMQAQLSASLTGVSTINSVSIAVSGNVQDIPALSVAGTRVDPRPLALTEDGFGFLGGGSVERLPGLSPQIEALGAAAAVVNANHSLAAVLTGDGVYAVRQSQSSGLRVDARTGLIAPSLDRFGFIWSVPQGEPGALLAIRADGSQSPISSSWPDASSIQSIQVSRDGTRLLALVRTAAEPRLLVAGITRGENNTPVSLGDPLVLAVGDGAGLSATWIDEITVASLVGSSDGRGEVVTQVIGGESEQLATLDDAVQVVGGNTVKQLRALSSDGNVRVLRTSLWQTTATGVAFLATQLGSPS